MSYYVTKENEDMEFSLIPDNNSQISNIWARGQLEINTTLNPNSLIEKKKDNYYIIKNSKDIANFTVIGKSGDFINIFFSNYNKISIYLNKHVFPKKKDKRLM